MYDFHDMLSVAPTATNPRLTEQGLSKVFRLAGRDDRQGELAAAIIAAERRKKRVAIVRDGQGYGGVGMGREASHRSKADEPNSGGQS